MEILYTTGIGSCLETIKNITPMKKQTTKTTLMAKIPWNLTPSSEV
jgi:hypothetical protein